jgi:hypothetical protein
MRVWAIAVVAAASLGCVGTTGGDLFTFDAAAAGPADAPGGAFAFTSPRGFEVTLERAKLHVGAVYLNDAVPTSGAQATNCILPGVYVAEVTHQLEVDLLNPTSQPFPGKGEALGQPALAAEVWLMHGDVNQPDSGAVILDVAGTAERDGEQYPFEGSLTIGRNRLPPVIDPSMPSAHPICKERIVSPIRVDLTPTAGGSLLLRVDPRGFFTNVDFSGLKKASSHPLLYRFQDNDDDPPSLNLFRGVEASSGVYAFEWKDNTKP